MYHANKRTGRVADGRHEARPINIENTQLG